MSTLFLLFLHFLYLGIGKEVNEDRSYWWKEAQKTLKSTLERKENPNIAKNVIMFIGDGMGIATLTAARILKGQQNGHSGEEELLAFEKFPHIALIKTYCTDSQVPDSACTATAFYSGVKTRIAILGLDSSVSLNNCSAVNEKNRLPNLAHWAFKKGKSIGVVTTTRITHATPAALYAHIPHRDWENDTSIPNNCQGSTKDIARQLVEDFPGNQFKVILGGGWQNFRTVSFLKDGNNGIRKDEDLIEKWLMKEKKEKRKSAFVSNAEELNKVESQNIDSLLGLFSPSHMSYDVIRPLQQPCLYNMTKKAIQVLNKSEKGFFLLVEGGLIDQAHHAGWAVRALKETIAFEEAVKLAVEMTNEEDTLIVVTADHSHTMVIGGYPLRGNPIGGLSRTLDSNVSNVDQLPYTTLLYGNGPGYTLKNGTREDITSVETGSFNYKQQSAIPLASETHGGEDVVLYAKGPMSHLFHSLHEQNYIAHAISYAACIEENAVHCSVDTSKDPSPSGKLSGTSNNFKASNILLLVIILLILHFKF